MADRQPTPLLEPCPHALDPARVARSIGVVPSQGLSSSEADERRSRFGANAFQTIRPRPVWRILLDQFANAIRL